MADTTSARGHHVKSLRGYVIREWSGPGVEGGTTKPFSVEPSGSFDRPWSGGSLTEAEAWIASAPGLRVVRATIEAYVPVAATEEEIEDWVRFGLHATGSLAGSNPLMDHEFVAHEVSVDDVREVR